MLAAGGQQTPNLSSPPNVCSRCSQMLFCYIPFICEFLWEAFDWATPTIDGTSCCVPLRKKRNHRRLNCSSSCQSHCMPLQRSSREAVHTWWPIRTRLEAGTDCTNFDTAKYSCRCSCHRNLASASPRKCTVVQKLSLLGLVYQKAILTT